MSHLADSRAPIGIGFIPAQDHGYERRGARMHDRSSLLAVRVKGRRTGAGEAGQWTYEDGHVGDMSGWFFWPKATRPIPTVREVMPTITPRAPGAPGEGFAGTGGPAGEVPPDSREPFDPRDITPSSGFTGYDLNEAAQGFPSSGSGTTSDAPRQGQLDGFDMVPCPPESATFEKPDRSVLPIRDAAMQPDRAFAPVEPARPNWPELPGGTVTAVVQATDESRQVEVLLHCDPRLIAAHRGGAPAHGSMVCDLSTGGDISPTRSARLQTIMRVIAAPTGQLSWSTNRENTLAITFGRTGLGEGEGGLIADACGSDVRIGHLGVRDGGPIDAGGGKDDPHVYAQTADGIPIHPAHLSGRAFWREHRHDGPMEFDRRPYIVPQLFPYLAFTYLRFDAGAPYRWPRDAERLNNVGMWKWETYVPLGQTDDPRTITPTDPPPPPDGGGPTTPGGETGGPTTPGGGPRDPDGGEGKGDPVVTSSGSGADWRGTLATHQEIALPSLAARPQLVEVGAWDLRYTRVPRPDALSEHGRTAPIVARLEAFGAQGGLNGWAHAQEPGASRATGGTAPGGWVVLPPELDMADSLSSFAPAGVTPSQTYFVLGPGVRGAAGTPDLSTGGIKSGYVWEESSGDLLFSQVNGSGTVAPAFSLTSERAAVLKNLSGDPTTPTAGAALYSKSGQLYERRSDGTVSAVVGTRHSSAAKTSDYTIPDGSDDVTITNVGASGTVIVTLPTAVAGARVCVIVAENQQVDVAPASGDTLYRGVTEDASGSRSSSKGSSITLEAVDDTTWVARAVTGSWASIP